MKLFLPQTFTLLAAALGATGDVNVDAPQLRGGPPNGKETRLLTGTDKSGPMQPLVWDNDNAATLEFCQVENSVGSVFGYRIPGQTYCGPAGVVIRMKPGQNYTLTLHNLSNETTNLHTHGLHISGTGDTDDVLLRHVDPGYCLEYYWHIPANHMGGSYWMHSHHAPLTPGAFSALIIEEQENLLENVKDEKDKTNIQAWLDNELILLSATDGEYFLGNGVTDLEIDMTQGEWYRLRSWALSKYGHRLNLHFPDTCDVYPVAYDGVWRFQTPSLERKINYMPTGAGRIDMAIRCNQVGYFGVTLGGENTPVATLVVSEGSISNAHPFVIGAHSENESWEPVRPYYLRDLSLEQQASFENYEIEMQDTMKINGYNVYSNGTNPLAMFEYGTLQEWSIHNSGRHPFHLHVYQMQTFNCDGHEDGQYYDTIVALNEECQVRFEIVDFGGIVVAHCTNRPDVFAGMLTWFYVEGGGAKANYTNYRQITCPSN